MNTKAHACIRVFPWLFVCGFGWVGMGVFVCAYVSEEGSRQVSGDCTSDGGFTASAMFSSSHLASVYLWATLTHFKPAPCTALQEPATLTQLLSHVFIYHATLSLGTCALCRCMPFHGDSSTAV